MSVKYFKTSVAKAMADPIETTVLQDVLLMVNVDVPREVLCKWSVRSRAIAEDWAVRLHLRASDNLVRVPQKPRFVTVAEGSKLPRDRTAATEALMAKRARNPKASIFDLLEVAK